MWPSPIFDRPDDDAPRLALAAELDARRDPRGELIRIQCELAGPPGARDPIGLDHASFQGADVEIPACIRADRSPSRVDLLARERRLLDAHGAAWRAPIEAAVRPCPMSAGEARDFVHRPRTIDTPIYAARFRRGFIEAVDMEARAFAADGAAALAVEPVRAARLYRPSRLVASICASPALAQLEALELGDEGIYQHCWDCIDDDEIALVAASDALGRLRALGLSGHAIGPRGVQALARSGALTALTAINLGLNPFLTSPEAVAALADAAWMDQIVELRLDADGSFEAFPMGADGALALAASPRLGRLRALAVKWADIGGRGAAAIVGSPRLGALERLDLTGNRLSEGGAAVLAGALVAPRIATLVLESTGLGDDGLAALARAPGFAGIRALDLAWCEIGARGARALAGSPRASSLRELSFAGDAIGDEGAAALAASPHLANLRSLSLWRSGITLAGLRALAASPHLAGLERLVLRDDVLGDDAIEVLAEASFAPSLRELDLGFSQLGERGIRSLAERPFLAHVEMLSLAGCDPGNWGLEALLDSPHLHRLAALDLSSSKLGRLGAMVLSRVPSLERLSLLRVLGNKLGSDGTAALRERFGSALVVDQLE